jgi:hypothetical protein
MGYYIAPPAVDPGQEALAQTQASVLQAVTTNPVSVPAPISDTAAKIGIFSNPTYPEPPVVSVPNTINESSSYYGAGRTTPNVTVGDAPANPDYGNEGRNAAPANPDYGNEGRNTPPPSNPDYGNEGRRSANAGSTDTSQNNNPVTPTSPNTDWRVTLKLAANANYLYKVAKPGDVLYPLKDIGIIFPYTPSISMNYSANYDPFDLTHSNYKVFQYKNSSVGDISIQADFTAQDTREANYLLAVIHFFRSATKMFYGKDTNPPNGTPPPLCYISGFGQYQFDDHPVVISNFSYHLPPDVDYIKAGVLTSGGATPSKSVNTPPAAASQKPSAMIASFLSKTLRLGGSGLTEGAKAADPVFKTNSIVTPTYVPTKISISLTLLPMISRYDVSQRFSVEKYASGEIYSGSRAHNKGIW